MYDKLPRVGKHPFENKNRMLFVKLSIFRIYHLKWKNEEIHSKFYLILWTLTKIKDSLRWPDAWTLTMQQWGLFPYWNFSSFLTMLHSITALLNFEYYKLLCYRLFWASQDSFSLIYSIVPLAYNSSYIKSLYSYQCWQQGKWQG